MYSFLTTLYSGMSPFIKATNDWEVKLVTSFFNLLHSLWLSRVDKDRMYWILYKRRRLGVISFYKALSSPVGFSLLRKSTWRNKEDIDFG